MADNRYKKEYQKCKAQYLDIKSYGLTTDKSNAKLDEENNDYGKMFDFVIDEAMIAYNMYTRRKNWDDPETFKVFKKIEDDNSAAAYMLWGRGISNELYKNPQLFSKLIDDIKDTNIYKVQLDKIKKYKTKITNEWLENKETILKEFENITRIDIPILAKNKHTVYLVPRSGRNLGQNRIEWGALNPEDFPNYGLVYMFHEYLHTLFGNNHVSHAIIELIADNELRKRLNGDKDYEFEGEKTVGHPWLANLRNKMLPDWYKYLNGEYKDIYDFREQMMKKFKKEADKINAR